MPEAPLSQLRIATNKIPREWQLINKERWGDFLQGTFLEEIEHNVAVFYAIYRFSGEAAGSWVITRSVSMTRTDFKRMSGMVGVLARAS